MGFIVAIIVQVCSNREMIYIIWVGLLSSRVLHLISEEKAVLLTWKKADYAVNCLE